MRARPPTKSGAVAAGCAGWLRGHDALALAAAMEGGSGDAMEDSAPRDESIDEDGVGGDEGP